MSSLPITTASVTVPVQIAAIVLLSTTVSRHRRRWVLVVTSSIVALVAFVAVRASAASATIPSSFVLWSTALVTAALAGILGWRAAGWPRRLLGVLTIVSVGTAGAVVVNAYYGYYPTLADAAHRPLPDQLRPNNAVIGATAAASVRDETRGRLVPVRIPTPRSEFAHRKEWIYLPPVWFAHPRPALPVVVLLPGTPGTTEDWIRAGGATQTANRWAATHHGRAPILVFADPNGSFRADTECVDTRHALVDTYLSVDLPEFVRTTFATAASPDRWGIGGASAGGTCALTIALRHPDVYHTIIDLSGEQRPNHGPRSVTLRTLFDGSAAAAARYDPATLLQERTYAATHAWFAAGDHDRPARHAIDGLVAASARAGIETRTSIGRGGHTWRYWRRAFADAFAWINNKIDTPGATR